MGGGSFRRLKWCHKFGHAPKIISIGKEVVFLHPEHIFLVKNVLSIRGLRFAHCMSIMENPIHQKLKLEIM